MAPVAQFGLGQTLATGGTDTGPQHVRLTGSQSSVNLRTAAGNPTGAVDVIFYVETHIGTGLFGFQYAIRTGTGWHADATVTLVLNKPDCLVCGGWALGGRDKVAINETLTYWHNGGGGGGAGGAGFGGNSAYAPGHRSHADPTHATQPTMERYAGAGGYRQHSSVGWPGRTATAGAYGRHALWLDCDLTVFNYAGVIAGAGGGGGGGGQTSNTPGRGGNGGELGQAGSAGVGTGAGSGGAAGTLVKLNGHTITWAVRGEAYGAEIA